MNIYESMIAIMRETGAIGKDQKNAQQGFNYRGIDDVYNALHDSMAKHGVMSIPTVLEKERSERKSSTGGVLAFTCLRMRYTFYAEDGSSIECVVEGEGMDSGDKSSNKAMAVAHKYALLQCFCIPTKDLDDPDAESPQLGCEPRQRQSKRQKPQPADNPASLATTPQIRKLFATAREYNVPDEELKSVMRYYFKIESTKQLTSDQVSKLIDVIPTLQPGSNDPADPHDAPADSTADTSGEVPPSPPDDLPWWEVVPQDEQEKLDFWTRLDTAAHAHGATEADLDFIAQSHHLGLWPLCTQRGDKLVKIARAMHEKGWL